MELDALPELAIVRDSAAALALLDPERRRLAAALAENPDSASGLARRLGETRQRLNYHLRVLEEAGLVEPVERRPRGSRAERILRASARRYLLDPAAVDPLAAAHPHQLGDRFSANYLLALAARAIRELAELLERADSRHDRLATVSFNTRVRISTPARLNPFVEDLTRAIADVVARHHQEEGEGRWFRLIGGAYPGPPPSTAEEEESDG